MPTQDKSSRMKSVAVMMRICIHTHTYIHTYICEGGTNAEQQQQDEIGDSDDEIERYAPTRPEDVIKAAQGHLERCVYIHVCMYVCLYACMYVALCVYMCVHMHIHIHTYIYGTYTHADLGTIQMTQGHGKSPLHARTWMTTPIIKALYMHSERHTQQMHTHIYIYVHTYTQTRR